MIAAESVSVGPPPPVDRVEESPESQNDDERDEAIPTLGGFFDSLADSLAQNDRFLRAMVRA
jgi:hypothetical protein